jgi:PAS domain S-box-containing protein
MTDADPASTHQEMQQLDASELRLHFALEHEIDRVGSFERLMHVALRLMVPHFGASHGVVLAPERDPAGPRVVAQIGARTWEMDPARLILATGRSPVPPEILYTPLREHGKLVAVLLLYRSQPFARGELRALLHAAGVVSDRLAELADARVVDVLARIDHKISRELRIVDLLYQILDGLELLTRYDHSGAILLFDREHSHLELNAERIVWRKMKSPHIRRVLPLEQDVVALLQQENRGFVLRRAATGGAAAPGGQAATSASAAPGAEISVQPLFESLADDNRLLAAPAERLASLFELLGYGRAPDAPAEASMLVVPLLFGPRFLGLVKLSALQPGFFTASDAFVVGRVVEKMSATIRNAGLYGRRLAELRAINDIGKLVTRPLPLEETCSRILDIVLQVTNTSAGSIELLDRDGGRLRVLASRGESLDAGLPLGEGITGTVAQTGKPLLVNDVSQQPLYVMRRPTVRSELAVPIIFEGTTVGVLNVESNSPDRFSERDVDFLSILADKTATALETLEQREHRRATLELLHELGVQLMLPENLKKLLQLTADLTRKHLCCEVATIYLFEDGRFRRRAIAGLPEEWFLDESYGSGEGLTGRAALLGDAPLRHAIVDNAVADNATARTPMLERYRNRLPSGRIAHLIAVPLLEGNRPVGLLRVLNRLTRDGRLVPGGFIDADAMLLTTIASQLSLAIANFKKRQRIQQMSAKLENQVRQRTEEAHRLASFVENAPLAILEVDPQGVLRFINEAGERMFGYQAAEMRDRPVNAAGLGLLGDAFADLMRVVEYMGFWSGEITYRKSDGKSAPAFLSARALRDPSGALRGVVVFARDISATKDLERQLLEAEGKRAMADLAGGVAHDLNNALGAILPTIQALQADVEEGRFDAQQFLADLRQVESYTRLSVRIFQGMLAMSRGTFALDKLVSVNERVQTALDILSLRIEKSAVTVRLELQPDLPLTLAHPGRVEQVVHNLVNNALDAMPGGGTLTVRTWSDRKSIFLEVIDTGVGIAEEQLARVQEPFYTSKRHGTGLGLSVVRSIVWEHNGQMTLHSRVGKGTTMHIEIPVRNTTSPTEKVGEREVTDP